MKHLFILTCILASVVGYGQSGSPKNTPPSTSDIVWATATHWKIYSLPGKRAGNFPIDTLGNFKSRSLEDDSMRSFLTNSRKVEVAGGVVWQGYIVGTCEIAHTLRKVIFSIYGGFFFDPATSAYYEIPEDLELRKDWHAYLNSALLAADPQAIVP